MANGSVKTSEHFVLWCHVIIPSHFSWDFSVKLQECMVEAEQPGREGAAMLILSVFFFDGERVK